MQEIRVLIDNQQVGGIIGKGGANVKRVREESGAFVSILKAEFRTVHERVMVLKGYASQIAKAAQLIADLLISASSKDRKSSSMERDATHTAFAQTSMRVLVHRSVVGAIIGKQGTVIKQTQNTTGARVQVSNDPLPNSTEKSITITGSPEAIEAAAHRILSQLRSNPLRPNTKSYPYVPGHHMMYSPSPYITPFHTPQPPNMYSTPQPGMGGMANFYPSEQKIAIPTACAGCVIGKRGAVIKSLQGQSGTNISIAAPESSNLSERIVTVYGNPQGIRMAVFLIRQLVEQYVPPAHHSQSRQSADSNSSGHNTQAHHSHSNHSNEERGGGGGGEGRESGGSPRSQSF